MNKAELIDAIASDSGLSKADAKRALDSFINTTSKALKKGDRVALVGFGSFSVSQKKDDTSVVAFDAAKSRLTEVYPLYHDFFWADITYNLADYLNTIALSELEDVDHGQFLTAADYWLSRVRDVGEYCNPLEFLYDPRHRPVYIGCADTFLKGGIDSFFDIWVDLSDADRKELGFYIDSFFDISYGALTEQAEGFDRLVDDVDMSKNPVTEKTIIQNIMKKTGLSERETAFIVDSFFDITYQVASRGETLDIEGFGSFSISKRAARTGRNPQTGKEIKIAAKNVVRFKAGSELSGKVN